MENEKIKTPEEKNSILQLHGLTKKFDEIIAVNDVDFDVYEGEILGIIGSNGSGKTTLFNMISGVLKPTSGKIYAVAQHHSIFDILTNIRLKFRDKIEIGDREAVNIAGLEPHTILNKFGIGRTFQIVKPFKFMTALENVTVPHVPKIGISKPSTLRSKAMSSLLSVDLGEKQKYPAAVLPHGDLKRLDIARTLATQPKILMLDEPFGGLSSQDAFRITELIKKANQSGVTIIIVEHKLKLLSNLVSRIIVLDQGRVIAEGTPKEISKNKRVIQAYLGMEADHIA